MTKRTRIEITAWGTGTRRLRIPAYCYLTDASDGSRLDAIIRSIERANRMCCCAGPRHDGTEMSRGRAAANHYQATFGRPCTGGGYRVEGEIWLSVPARAGIEVE